MAASAKTAPVASNRPIDHLAMPSFAHLKRVSLGMGLLGYLRHNSAVTSTLMSKGDSSFITPGTTYPLQSHKATGISIGKLYSDRGVEPRSTLPPADFSGGFVLTQTACSSHEIVTVSTTAMPKVDKCCCQVVSLTVTEPKRAGSGVAQGHIFEAKINIQYHTHKRNWDCTLEWWEKWSRIHENGQIEPGEWTDEVTYDYKDPAERQRRDDFFKPWTNRPRDCPSGIIPITLRDSPSLATTAGNDPTVSRLLKIAIVARSGGGGELCQGAFVKMVTILMTLKDHKVIEDQTFAIVGTMTLGEWLEYSGK